MEQQTRDEPWFHPLKTANKTYKKAAESKVCSVVNVSGLQYEFHPGMEEAFKSNILSVVPFRASLINLHPGETGGHCNQAQNNALIMCPDFPGFHISLL